MANRKLIVQVVGDDESLRRAFRRSSTGAKTFDRDIGRATRGALAGSGVFRSLGRSIAFASGGFLAFATAGQFLRTSIDAAKDAAVVQKQLGAQFRASGQDLAKYQGAIDETANRLALLAGFQNDEVKSSFVTIFRASGDVSKSLRDTALAADIARARHLSLSAAAVIVGKVEAGNIGILRRAGVQIGKNATVEEALAVAREKFAGQARAGTTAQERFGAVLHNTEEIIGGALLPVLNKYLTSGSKWLTQMNESGRLQKDVADATHAVGEAFSAARELLRPLLAGFRLLESASGGTRHALELLGAAFLALELRAKLIKWGLIATGIERVGAAATVASAETTTLATRLGLLARLGPIFIPIVLGITFRKQIQAAGDKVFGGPDTLDLTSFSQFQALPDWIKKQIPASTVKKLKAASAATPRAGSAGDMRGAFANATGAPAGGKDSVSKTKQSVSQVGAAVVKTSNTSAAAVKKHTSEWVKLGGAIQAIPHDMRTVADALKKTVGGSETAFVKANTKKLLAGLGLDPSEVRAVRARLSQVGAGGTVPRGSAGAAGKQPDIVIHTVFEMDGRPVAVNTTRHQQKARKRNPGQRRGPHAGA